MRVADALLGYVLSIMCFRKPKQREQHWEIPIKFMLTF